ncbi:hypothetical protein ETB97_000547 [Aspergillus alliaceus]|uniref:Uncharacterized protein n=1 Tax=Petromyces alliaceus TaxID=209559 RepID=A0A8H6A1W7_PETAA|nr:hypothetical protein ETB97_000547 [Aspergillus burnettii]
MHFTKSVLAAATLLHTSAIAASPFEPFVPVQPTEQYAHIAYTSNGEYITDVVGTGKWFDLRVPGYFDNFQNSNNCALW